MTERELDQRAAHRLAIIRHVEEVTDNVSETCRYYGKRAPYRLLGRRDWHLAARECAWTMASPAANIDGQRTDFRNESRTMKAYNIVGDR